jgi:hypothetical protein
MVSPKKQKRTLLDGLEPLSYLGVEATSPASVVTDVRDPISGTDKDYYGFYVGDQWINRNTLVIWELVSKEPGIATWVALTTGALPTGGTDGQVIIAATGGPSLWANLTSSDGSITIVNGPNSIDITTVGGAGIVATLSDDAGNLAVPLGGDIKLEGGANINTDALTTPNTVIINLDTSIVQPVTNAAGTEGLYSLGAHRFMHDFGTVGNTFLGEDAGNLTNTGSADTGIGFTALEDVTTGTFNSALGAAALANVTTGDYNTGLGAAAGSLVTTGISNIYINNQGVAAETGKLRIGDPAVPANTLTNSYIDGIYQKVTGDVAVREVVTIDADGKLCSALLTNSATVTINNAPGTISFTAAGGGGGLTTFVTDAGNATVAAGSINDFGSTNIHTTGAGATVTTYLNDSIILPATNAAGTTGLISLNGVDFMSGFGTDNAFLGGAGNRVTLTGQADTFVGKRAGQLLTSGVRNTGIGKDAALRLTTGSYNVAVGDSSGERLTTGESNIAIGSVSLGDETTGSRNISIGAGSSLAVVGRSDNTIIGNLAGADAVGGGNVIIGSNAGNAAIASENIMIGHNVIGAAAEANTTRIGLTTQTAAYMGGIYQKAINATNEQVIVDAAGKLGTQIKSAFRAEINRENNVTGNGTEHLIGSVVATTEGFDLHGDFYPGNGAGTPASFTIPVNGVYILTSEIGAEVPVGGGLEFTTHIHVDGVNAFAGCLLPTRNRCAGFYGANGFLLPGEFSTIMKLNAGSVVTWSITIGGGAKTSDVVEGAVSGALLYYA